MSRKTYVLDTSAIIFNPLVFNQFPGSDVLIPIAVLNELDKLKKGSNDVARSARVAIRSLEEISNQGDISTGVLLEQDIILKVDASYLDLSDPPYNAFGEPSYGDTQILACLYANWLSHATRDVILISNDINLRIKAKARGIEAEARDNKGSAISEMYSGVQIITNVEAAAELQQNGFIDPDDYGLDLSPHECVIFQDAEGVDIAMGRRNIPSKVSLIKKFYPWGLNAKNREQSISIDMMMNKDIDLVTIIGIAGCGKSLLSIACGLELVLNKREYEKLLIYRAITPVGQDLGYLPGSKEEKLEPWMTAIQDSFQVLMSGRSNGNWKQDLEMYQKKGRIEMDSFMHIRGRSISNAIIILDEAQNISKSDMKLIISRAGEGTKILVSGDIEQVDLKGNDASNNGLSYVIDNFRNSWLAAHITFLTGERSRLATQASEIL